MNELEAKARQMVAWWWGKTFTTPLPPLLPLNHWQDNTHAGLLLGVQGNPRYLFEAVQRQTEGDYLLTVYLRKLGEYKRQETHRLEGEQWG